MVPVGSSVMLELVLAVHSYHVIVYLDVQCLYVSVTILLVMELTHIHFFFFFFFLRLYKLKLFKNRLRKDNSFSKTKL